MARRKEITGVRIKLATPERIHAISKGEVKPPLKNEGEIQISQYRLLARVKWRSAVLVVDEDFAVREHGANYGHDRVSAHTAVRNYLRR